MFGEWCGQVTGLIGNTQNQRGAESQYDLIKNLNFVLEANR